MTNAPILRSVALQKALALAPTTVTPPVRGRSAPAAFASTLSAAEWSAATALRSRSLTVRKSLAANDALEIGKTVPFQDMITSAAQKYGIRPALLVAVVKQESNFNPNAKSGVGAKGLTQLMDATARGLGVTDPFDPAQSLDGGARFLGGLLKQFKGNESLALAAYNAGPGAVQKYGGIPPYQETQRYVPKVLGYAAQFSRILAGS